MQRPRRAAPEGARRLFHPRVDEVERAACRRERLREEADHIGEDQQRQALVEHAAVTGAEEDESQGDGDPRHGIRDVGEPLERAAQARRLAPGEDGDGDCGKPRNTGRGSRGKGRVDGGLPGQSERGSHRGAFERPPREHSQRQSEEKAHARGARSQGGPPPATEADRPRASARSGRRAERRAAPPHVALQDHDHGCQRDEHERQDRCRVPVEQRLVLQVDGAGERRILHQRDRAEVREDVERDEECRRAECRPESGERDRQEDPRRGATERPSGFLQRHVDRPQGGSGDEKDVRIRGQCQREEGSLVAVDVREPFDAERCEPLLEQPSRTERAEQDERADVARDHERQRQRDAPDSRTREVGSDDEPRERRPEYERDRDDARDEQHRVEDEPQRGLKLHRRTGVCVGAEGSNNEVDAGQQHARDDDHRRHRERARPAAAPRGGGCRRRVH